MDNQRTLTEREMRACAASERSAVKPQATPESASLRREPDSLGSRSLLRSPHESEPLLDLHTQESSDGSEGRELTYSVRNLSFAYSNQLILDDISFDIAKGKITALLGANGSGKSTLFKLLTKNLRARAGAEIMLEGRSLSDYRLGELARKVAVVWQKNSAPYDITVRELVAYGRIPHKKAFQSLTHEDEAAIDRALNICELDDIAESRMQELSGGQQQRVWIALGIAQETPIMFLDEPTTFLDVRYQVMILRLIRKLNKELGMTVVLILHDVNQTLGLCDELIALYPDGASLLQGTPQELITEDFLRDIYNTDLRMIKAENQSIVFSQV